MLRRMKMRRLSISATDGFIGHVRIITSMMKHGSFVSGGRDRSVAFRPKSADSLMAINQPNGPNESFPSRSLRASKDSPNIDTDKPVSRQHEALHLEYYRYPYYGVAPGVGPAAYQTLCSPRRLWLVCRTYRGAQIRVIDGIRAAQNEDPHLRSGNTLCGITFMQRWDMARARNPYR